MGATKVQIITDIDAYMKQRGGTNTSWYVGIAADARSRLFNDHRVSETEDTWIYRQAMSSTVARETERAYLDTGHDGGPGGGDDDTTYVYAYLKSRRTNP
jgi:hypothetical protein